MYDVETARCVPLRPRCACPHPCSCPLQRSGRNQSGGRYGCRGWRGTARLEGGKLLCAVHCRGWMKTISTYSQRKKKKKKSGKSAYPRVSSRKTPLFHALLLPGRPLYSLTILHVRSPTTVRVTSWVITVERGKRARARNREWRGPPASRFFSYRPTARLIALRTQQPTLLCDKTFCTPVPSRLQERLPPT